MKYFQIEPTTRCNYTCGFCVGRCLPQQDLAFSKFIEIIESVEELEHVELQGEGEPLLHPRFFSMVESLHLRQPGVKVSFITNGSLFTKDNIRKILSAGIHRILISIESADSKEFQSIRGGKLERVIRGVESLIDARKDWTGNVPAIGFAVTVLKSTLQQISPIADLYRRLGMDGGISIQPLQVMESYMGVYDQSMVDQCMTASDVKQYRQVIASDKNVLSTVSQASAKVGFYEEMYNSLNHEELACPWLKSGLYVTAQGTTTSCCFVKDDKRFGAGVLGSDSINRIRRSQHNLQEVLNAGKLPVQCKGCSIAHNILQQRKRAS